MNFMDLLFVFVPTAIAFFSAGYGLRLIQESNRRLRESSDREREDRKSKFLVAASKNTG
jgi:hypothetical protein